MMTVILDSNIRQLALPLCPDDPGSEPVGEVRQDEVVIALGVDLDQANGGDKLPVGETVEGATAEDVKAVAPIPNYDG